jgi:uncharacterized protein YbgA (DUF1722 family)
VSSEEREYIAELIRAAVRQGTLESVQRALSVAERYLAQHPDDWEVAFAIEPLVLMHDLLAAEQAAEL